MRKGNKIHTALYKSILFEKLPTLSTPPAQTATSRIEPRKKEDQVR
jgi:hypothetical protein